MNRRELITGTATAVVAMQLPAVRLLPSWTGYRWFDVPHLSLLDRSEMIPITVHSGPYLLESLWVDNTLVLWFYPPVE